MATRSEAGTPDRSEASCTPLSMRKVAGHRMRLFEHPQVAGPLLKELTEPLYIGCARKGSATLPARYHHVIGSTNAFSDHFLGPATLQACPAEKLIGNRLCRFLDHEYILLTRSLFHSRIRHKYITGSNGLVNTVWCVAGGQTIITGDRLSQARRSLTKHGREGETCRQPTCLDERQEAA